MIKITYLNCIFNNFKRKIKIFIKFLRRIQCLFIFFNLRILPLLKKFFKENFFILIILKPEKSIPVHNDMLKLPK